MLLSAYGIIIRMESGVVGSFLLSKPFHTVEIVSSGSLL